MRSSKKWAPFHFAFVALLALTLLLSPRSTNAQLSAGSVTGIVRDATGSVIADASVTLRNIDTTIEHKTVSNDAGNYVFLNLGPGRYALEARAPGFATRRITELVLAVNQTASIDISLQVGSQSDVVTISAETEQLDVATADLGTVIATKQVNDLPLNGRNFTQLLSLTPGVAPVSVSQNSMGGRAGGFGAPISVGSAFIFPAVNGQTNRSNFFLTDGLNNFGTFQSRNSRSFRTPTALSSAPFLAEWSTWSPSPAATIITVPLGNTFATLPSMPATPFCEKLRRSDRISLAPLLAGQSGSLSCTTARTRPFSILLTRGFVSRKTVTRS